MTDRRPASAPPSASQHTRRQFALTGRSQAFDPRIVAARGDLADVRLADRIFAPHYAAAIRQTATRRTPVMEHHGGDPLSEVLQGETFDVLELSHGYAWGVGGVDGTVGFVDVSALGPFYAVSHVVCERGGSEPIGTRVAADAAWQADPVTICELDSAGGDVATAAEALVGVPEVAGGRSGAGVDHGGLIALALSLCGILAPRFVALQADQLGHAVAAGAPVLRGDLLFRDDAAAIALDDTNVVAIVDGAVRRVALTDFTVDTTTRRRLP